MDIARTFAIALVVFCHSIESIYRMNMQEWQTLSIQSQLFRTIAFTIARLGVPLFLYISGTLLLSKNIENTDDCIKFYKKNLLPLLLTIEIWNVLYNIFIPILKGTTFNIKETLLNVLFLKQVGVPNMWYMPMIIGVYLAVPFLAIIVKKIDFKIIRIPMMIVFLSSFLLPNIGLITKVLYKESYNIIIYLSFLGREYGLYVLLGNYIGNGKLKKIKSIYLWIIAFLAFIISILYQIWLYNRKYAYNVWYDFTGILITSACIFELLSRMKIKINEKLGKIFTYISKISLGIFFVHILVKYALEKYINFDIINKPISVFVQTISVFIISIIIIGICSKVKFIKQKIFLIKE